MLSENTLNSALRRMDYANSTHTAHGFRASARTLLDEELGVKEKYIEFQLSHQLKDSLGGAYNRSKHLEERAAMMQRWADYLDKLKENSISSTAAQKLTSNVLAFPSSI